MKDEKKKVKRWGDETSAKGKGELMVLVYNENTCL